MTPNEPRAVPEMCVNCPGSFDERCCQRQPALPEGATPPEPQTPDLPELLACPFCGGAGRLVISEHAGMAWVACPTCGLEAPSETGVTASEAVTFWNTRPTEQPDFAHTHPEVYDMANGGGVERLALLIAREAIAKSKDQDNASNTAKLVRSGQYDGITEVRLAYMGALAALTARPSAPAEVGWHSVNTAPKDATILELLVDYTDGSGPLQDGIIVPTVGWNAFADTGEDEWQFLGWDWCQDCICAGKGKVIGWRPSRLNGCDDALGPIVASAAPVEPGSEREAETAWLIERGGRWFAPKHSEWTIRQAVDPRLWEENWTTDANEAMRFARMRDASTLIAREGWLGAEATEHQWLEALARPAADDAK